MKYTNGFFQLDIRTDGVYLKVFPAKEGGKAIDARELLDYLGDCGIEGFQKTELAAAVEQAQAETEIFVSETAIDEVDEKVKVTISDDRMLAYVRFYAPSTGGKYLAEEDIRDELNHYGIVHGIAGKVIQAYLKGRQFCRDIPIAKGTAVVQGRSGVIHYQFDTAPTAKPKLLDDGRVDFHQLNLFTSVKEGELLAELIPEVEGTPGIDVYGKPVQPNKIKKRVLKYGKNIRISEDMTKIYSEIDGDVKLEGDTVFVSQTYVVPADVDTSTGDIHYNGNVIVTGNVRSGFRIEAEGDIEVNGVVEGATVIATGNIVLKRGVQGMSKGYLQSGGDIVTKFLENCKVKSEHTINTGSSLHSDLVAGDKIVVSGKKGFLIGGTISAGKLIEASVFGNKMNTVTVLKVGVEPEVYEQYKAISINIKEMQDEMLECRQLLEELTKKAKEGVKLLPNQLMQFKQEEEKFRRLNAELEQESAKYKLLKSQIDENKDGKVVVNSSIYPGVSIYMSNRAYPVKEVRSRCQFKISGADVVISSI
ncbi:MAG: FapA family protein [Bacteroidales bacterium]|nr:FapA family protein [Clostridium sp.]MCM1202753.1 FapA family protein [Bacteroidales bacterium]